MESTQIVAEARQPALSARATWAETGLPVTLFAGSANRPLSDAVERELGIRFGSCTTERFPDGECLVRLDEAVRGHEVLLLQPTCPPVNDRLMELLIFADACRRAAAERVVAIVPYFGYARSDRRDGRRVPITASLVASLMEIAGIDHVVTLDVHTPAVEGFFRIPVDNLTAVTPIADALRERVSRGAVVVAPDLGAMKLASRYASRLDLPVAVCEKRRVSGTQVSISRVTGDVAGRPCLVVDDMITTGATVVECVRALRDAGAADEILVAASHPVLIPGALQRLAEAGVQNLVVTDSIALQPAPLASPRVQVVSVAPLLALAIRRILAGGSLRELA